jgi:hypothetical protein
MPIFFAARGLYRMAGRAPQGRRFSSLEEKDLLQVWPVSKRVNRPGNDEDVGIVEPVEATSF